MKHYIYILLTLCLLSCNGQTSTSDALSTFAKQEHRFEVRGCEFFYNDQKIELYKPKADFIKLFGDDFSKVNSRYHNTAPIVLHEKIRSWEQSDILDISSMFISFEKLKPSDKYYESYKDFPVMKKEQYILIDGVPFGHGVSISKLNQNLKQQGKQGFSGSFAGSTGIKGRGHLECENFPQFFINIGEKGQLKAFSYLQHKPKHLKQ